MAKRSNKRDVPDDWWPFATMWASDQLEFTSIEMKAAIIAEFQISEADQRIKYPKGKETRISNRISHILTHWRLKKFAEDVRGHHNKPSDPYRLTELGKREAAKLHTDLPHLIGDLKVLIKHPSLDATERDQLIQARLGQGPFRDDVLARAGNKCAVTGSTVLQAIRASHIKPWRDCDHKERLDPNNGLALTGTLDALFDAHLITFQDDGAMQVSPSITDDEQKILGLPMCLKIAVTAEMGAYLISHRKAFEDQLNLHPRELNRPSPERRPWSKRGLF